MPLLTAWVVAGSTSAIGTAARATIGAAAVRSVGLPAAAPTSSTVPQAWHSPQRPTQRTAVQPHSAQR